MIQRVSIIPELRKMKREMDKACEEGNRDKMLELCNRLIEISDQQECARCS